jgi:hypothetical protein
MRFQMMKDWYNLVLNVIIWGSSLPASLWYFSGSVLAFINGVDLTEQSLPYFNDTLQAMIFLIIYHFCSAAINKGFELFEIFDLKERHAMKNNTLDLYFKENLKNTTYFIFIGLPAFWLCMYLNEIGFGDFFIFLLVFLIRKNALKKYFFTNWFAHWFNKFEELPQNVPGFPNLRNEIE